VAPPRRTPPPAAPARGCRTTAPTARSRAPRPVPAAPG
jgi:hypothetical protein